jgi:hypothetical protein
LKEFTFEVGEVPIILNEKRADTDDNQAEWYLKLLWELGV